jgi:hypothetical protein
MRRSAACWHRLANCGVAFGDDTRRLIRKGVFPDPNDEQASSVKAPIGVTITRTIPLDLRLPELSSGLWHDEVLGTAVPEATVNEDIQAHSSEYDVRSPASIERQRQVDAEAESSTMQQRPEREFGTRVATPIRLHSTSCRRSNGERVCRP